MQAVPQRVFRAGVPSVGMVRVAAPAEEGQGEADLLF